MTLWQIEARQAENDTKSKLRCRREQKEGPRLQRSLFTEYKYVGRRAGFVCGRSEVEIDGRLSRPFGLDLQATAVIDQIRQFDSFIPPNFHNFTSTPPKFRTIMAPSMSLLSVNAILILNSDDGSRVFAKYYSAPHHTAGATHTSQSPLPSPPLLLTKTPADAPTAQTPYPDVKSQKAFEKGLVEKTAKQTADIILYDNRIVLYKSESDVMMYVVGGVDENEIMLYNVILALRDSLHLLFKYAPITSRCAPLPTPPQNS